MARLLQPQRYLNAWSGIDLGWAAVRALAGCAPGRPSPGAITQPPAAARQAIRLRSDGSPQAEHGGFYHALALGFYRQAGLEVAVSFVIQSRRVVPQGDATTAPPASAR